jgi:cephalosporin hydroxylase
MVKFPEDLRTYEHLLWLARPNVVIEVGSYWGGSALWFRDRLRVLQSYGRIDNHLVISIDVYTGNARRSVGAVDPDFSNSIRFVEADVRDPNLPAAIARMLPRRARCMVVEDSGHTYETTMAALEGFSRFVPVGGWFVVEDGCVDVEEMRADPSWERGVQPAMNDWLRTEDGSKFEVRRDVELYGLSGHPNGYLTRIRA